MPQSFWFLGSPSNFQQSYCSDSNMIGFLADLHRELLKIKKISYTCQRKKQKIKFQNKIFPIDFL